MLRRHSEAGRASSSWARSSLALVAVAASSAAATGCGKGGGGHGTLGALRDALGRGDAVSIGSATRDAPTCGGSDAGGAAPPCLAAIATWLGSKTGLQLNPPDQAAAGTAALVITRDGHGEWLTTPSPNVWLVALRTGTGAGADTLRLALAAAIAEKAGPLGRPLESGDDARAVMRAVAGTVPGACETYARLGAGDDPTAGPPERTADHAPCVQRDLERPMGPAEHGRYGTGLWRGAEGALALWWDVATALRDGVARTDPQVRGTLEANVVRIVAALGKVTTKKLPPAPDYLMMMGDLHVDAGVPTDPARMPRPGGSPPVLPLPSTKGSSGGRH